MTKEEILIGGGILAGVAGLAYLCFGIGDSAVKDAEANKDKNEALKKADQIWRQNKRTSGDVTDDMQARVDAVAARSKFAQVDIMSKLLKTEQWVRYAYFYMTDNSAELFELDTETCELCNGISVLAGFGKMYPMHAVADLKDYDLQVCDMDKNFIVDIDEVSSYVADGNFQIKMKLRKEALEKAGAIVDKIATGEAGVTKEQADKDSSKNWRLGSDGLYHLGKQVFKEDETLYRPFAVNNGGATQTVTPTLNSIKAPYKQPANMSTRDFEKVSSVLTPAIIGTDNYFYTYDENGLLVLNVPNPAVMGIANIPVDLGDIVGGSHVNVMGNYINEEGKLSSMFVDAENHPELATKIIQNPMYQLTKEEVEMCLEERKIPSYLIRYFDFANTPFIDELSAPAAERLVQRLNDILNLVRANINPVIDIPRFRFNNYENPDAFTVVSDDHVKTPIPLVMVNSHHDNNSPLIIEQRGNTLLQTFKGMTTAYDTTAIQVTINPSEVA